MLPKRISKRKEKQLAGQQLELKDNLSVQQKAKKKRKTLLIGLGLTIGLSLFFSLFRFSRRLSFNLHFSPPSFNLPSAKLSRSVKLDLQKPVFSLLKNPDLWQIYVTTLDPPLLSWSHLENPTNIDSSLTALKSIPPVTSGLATDVLPQGTIIQEIFSSPDYQVLISVPGQQIFIHLNGPDQNLYAPLIETIYWQVIKSSR